MDDGRQTTPGVWHKLPTGELKKYGFDILIFSGSYGGHRRHTTDDGRQTMPGVWHKLPTGGELKKYGFDILIFSGSYGGHTTYDGQRTTDNAMGMA